MFTAQLWQQKQFQNGIHMRKPRWLILFVVLIGLIISGCTIAAPPLTGATPIQQSVTQDKTVETLEFEVAENVTRFAFDETKTFDDGMPAHGGTFITQGYIYPKGTLNGTNGVLPDGSPEFPDKVIGEWSCRGWFVGDAAHTEAGPLALSTQTYQLGEEYGNLLIVSEGYEVLSETPFKRAITGGTGPYQQARGEVTQTLLGMTEEMAMSYQFKLDLWQ